MIIDMVDLSEKDASLIALNSFQAKIIFDALQDYYNFGGMSVVEKNAIVPMIEALKKVVF